MYADDTQLYFDFSPEDEVTIHTIIDECVGLKEIKEWLSGNFLLLNENKTEAITVMQVQTLFNSEMLLFHYLAVFDKKCRMEEHAAATRVFRSANHYLQRIRRIRDCLNFSNTKLLVHSLVT